MARKMRWKSWIKITLTCLGQNQSNMNSIVHTELLLSSCLYNLYSRKTHLEELDSTLTINFDTINSSIILCIWITDKIILIWWALGPLYEHLFLPTLGLIICFMKLRLWISKMKIAIESNAFCLGVVNDHNDSSYAGGFKII